MAIPTEFKPYTNVRFGFAFDFPTTWECLGFENSDGFLFTRDSLDVQFRIYAGFAVVSESLNGLVEWTIESGRQRRGFRLLDKASIPINAESGGRPDEPLFGTRLDYEFSEGERDTRVLWAGVQHQMTQFVISCVGPSKEIANLENDFNGVVGRFKVILDFHR